MRSIALPLLIVLTLGTVAYWWLDSRQPEVVEDGDRTLEAWVADLDAEAKPARYRAAAALVRAGEPAVPLLAERLGRDVGQPPDRRPRPEGTTDARRIAADALAQLGAPGRAALLEALLLEEHYERDLAARALRSSGVTAAEIPSLVNLLSADNPVLAGFAGGLLLTAGDPGKQAVEDWLTTLGPDDELEIGRALATLVADDPLVTDRLVERLDDTNPRVRESALSILATIGPRADQAAAIAARLADPAEPVAQWSATLLRAMGRDAARALVDVLKEGEPLARARAATLVAELQPEGAAAIDTIRGLLDEAHPEVPPLAAAALLQLGVGDARILEVLAGAAAAGPEPRRRAAVAALGAARVQKQAAARALVPLLAAEEGFLAALAADGLQKLMQHLPEVRVGLTAAAQAGDERAAAAKAALETFGPSADHAAPDGDAPPDEGTDK